MKRSVYKFLSLLAFVCFFSYLASITCTHLSNANASNHYDESAIIPHYDKLPASSAFLSRSSSRINVNLDAFAPAGPDDNPTLMDMAFSQASDILVTAEYKGMMKLWDVRTGRKIRSFKGNEGITSIAYSPKNNMLAAGYYGETVDIWNLTTGNILRKIKGQRIPSQGKPGGYTVLFSPDEKYLATCHGGWSSPRLDDDDCVRLWDLASGKMLYAAKGDRALFSPNGKYIAIWGSSVSSDKTKILDIATGNVIMKTDNIPFGFLHDSSGIVVHNNSAAMIKDLSTSREKKIFEIPNGYSIRNISPDYQFLITEYSFDYKKAHGSDKNDHLQLWSRHSQKRIGEFTYSPGLAWISGTFTLDGKSLMTFHEDAIIFWDAATASRRCTIRTKSVYSPEISPNSQFIAIDGPKVQLYDINKGTLITILDLKT